MSKTQTQEYRGNGEHSWEPVTLFSEGDVANGTTRLRVPGGWLYHTMSTGGGLGAHTDMVFVPMPEVVVHKV